jgi:hypothetical protein
MHPGAPAGLSSRHVYDTKNSEAGDRAEADILCAWEGMSTKILHRQSTSTSYQLHDTCHAIPRSGGQLAALFSGGGWEHCSTMCRAGVVQYLRKVHRLRGFRVVYHARKLSPSVDEEMVRRNRMKCEGWKKGSQI